MGTTGNMMSTITRPAQRLTETLRYVDIFVLHDHGDLVVEPARGLGRSELTERRGSLVSVTAQPAGPGPEDIEAAAALEEYREWSEAGRPGAVSHEQARRLLLGEDAVGQAQ
jgi:hypothetical protein